MMFRGLLQPVHLLIIVWIALVVVTQENCQNWATHFEKKSIQGSPESTSHSNVLMTIRLCRDFAGNKRIDPSRVLLCRSGGGRIGNLPKAWAAQALPGSSGKPQLTCSTHACHDFSRITAGWPEG
ncbi:MAG TPA: hypothetical protein DCP92_06640 [Nitrospiraceae bacterium]|jgi:hypothetical protein|nr:hypothetical protein [Nitrospiraceae bacterium]